MVLKNKEAKKYYEILKGIFPKATYLEARFLKDMQRSIAEFCMEHPSCTYEMISEEFGTPQEVLADIWMPRMKIRLFINFKD